MTSPVNFTPRINSNNASLSNGRYVFTGGSAYNKQPKYDNNYGVGLVNSDLTNLYYKLPNGESSKCNTRFIG